MGDVQASEVVRLTAEVEHWRAHAQEAGEGFSRVCRDYARVAARNVVLAREIERLGGTVPPDQPAEGNRFAEQLARAKARNDALPPHAGLIVTRPLVERRDYPPAQHPGGVA